jgi:hypothetical protein
MLIIFVALAIALAYIFIPVSLTSIYVGKLTLIGGVGALALLLFIALQLLLISTLWLRKTPHRLYLLAIFDMSLIFYFGSVLITSYLTNLGLGRPAEIYYSVWIGFVVAVGVAFILWRATPKSGDGMSYANSRPMVLR